MAGLSKDGRTFFYENPLESRGNHHRWTWHSCPCCPPNVARLLASIGAYTYALAEDEIAVHLYNESTARFRIADVPVTLDQATDYPWDGAIRFTVSPERPTRFALSLRIPAWAEGARLSTNGEATDLSTLPSNGYARIEREWSAGDTVDLHLPLAARRVWANPRVSQDAGRIAVLRGPLVYCAEEVDNGPGLHALVLPTTEATETRQPDHVGLSVTARRDVADWGDTLYRSEPSASEPSTALLVPYYLWDNRTPGEMLVWFRTSS
jgi:DUF1680 family protein